MNMERRRWVAWAWGLLAIGGLVFLMPDARGQADDPPEMINYQGVLDFAADNTHVNDVQDIEFRLYRNKDDAAVSAAIWGEKHLDVQMANGIFNVYIGAGDAIDGVAHGPLGDVLTQSGLWLGIKVGLDAEMTPRQQFLSVPYAMTAKHAVRAIHGAPAGTIVMFAGSQAPEGWLWCEGASLSAATDGAKYQKLWEAIGTTWGGSGQTAFNVPDFRGRALMGAGNGVDANSDNGSARLADYPGIPPTGYAVGTRVGQEKHLLIISEMAAHTHLREDQYPRMVDWVNGEGLDGVISGRSDSSKTTEPDNWSGLAHNSVQPSASVRWIIKY